MAAFADMLDLQVAVVDFIGDETIVDVMPRLVQLAEARFNREIRCREQITTDTLTFASGSAALPTDIAEIIGLFDTAGREYTAQPVQIVQDGTVYSFYAVDGANILAPGIEGSAELIYYATIPTLTTSMTTSNWLLARYPGVYLYGVGLEAAKYRKSVELATAAAAFLKQEMDDLTSDDARSRYARAAVRVVGVTP
jgi:hypothetical protein